MDHQDYEFEAADMQLHDEQMSGAQEAMNFRLKPDGAIDPAGEAGWFLQREREKRGETLEMAGDATGIHPYHIEAIEFGDMTHMPTRMEALEMISAYAQYLGFDPDPLIQHYLQFLPKPAIAPRAHHPANPAPLSSAKIMMFGRMPKLPPLKLNLRNIPGGTGGLVASVAGAVLLFAGASWMMMPANETGGAPQEMAIASDPMPTASTAPEATATAEAKIPGEIVADDQSVASLSAPESAPPEPQASSGAAIPEPLAMNGSENDGLGAFITEKMPASGHATKAVAKKPTAQAQVASANTDVVQTGTGRVFGANNPQARLVLVANAQVWIRVENAQGAVVISQMLMKGDSYRVPNQPGLKVISKDGGALSYFIDGQEKGALGYSGEVLDGRSLDLTSLQG